MRRLCAGCLVSPLWVPIYAALVASLTSPPAFMHDLSSGSWISGAIIVGTIAGYAGIIILGLPIHLLLRRRESSVWSYVVSWFVTALALWAIMFTAVFAPNGMRFSTFYLAETIVHRVYVPLSIGAIWALVGVTFWLIVQPDTLKWPGIRAPSGSRQNQR